MRAPIIASIAKRAVAAGYTTVRFNFRGVGQSTGAFSQGVGELRDVAAAVGFAETLEESVLGICGWSFGAAMALKWQALSGSGIDYVGIAPPVIGTLTPQLPEATELSPATRKFIVGARDQFVDVEDLESYAASIGASVEVYPSSDHFFVFKHDRLAADVISAFDS